MSNNRPYVDIHTHGNCHNAITIATIGTHPYMSESAPSISQEMITPQIEAIGEIGLDGVCGVDIAIQERLFREQLRLAQANSLPVVIHSVRSFEKVISILKEYSLRAVIFHGFIGSKEQALAALKYQNYYLSFGHRTWSSPKSVEALKITPINRLFFETDESDTPIEEIYSTGAQLRGETVDYLKSNIYNNFLTIFRESN